MGPCFVVRFSWRRGVEDPVSRVKSLPSDAREFEPELRRWWVSAEHADVLASLFTNWEEEVAEQARLQPDLFSATVVWMIRRRIVSSVNEVLRAAPSTTYDDLLRGVGEALGWWLEEWRRAAPQAAAAIGEAAFGRASETATAARQELLHWALRALCARDLLAPEPSVGGKTPGA
ncbi:MAG: hypothetical protein QHJ73_04490 [Armatimonadota bacterium]|nr:hypothetical protein [Armatimonadota bacterium]